MKSRMHLTIQKGIALGLPGLKRSVVAQGVYREFAAYHLDHDHFANLLLTTMIKITHSVSMLMREGETRIPKLLNDDGVQRFELIPIDHGLSLPEDSEDPYIEWIHRSQASIPFTEEEVKYNKDHDPYKNANMFGTELHMIKKTCHHVLIMSTIFLKEAASHGLSLSEIGEMTSRKFRHGKEEPSALELLCMDARRLVDEGKERGKGTTNMCIKGSDLLKEEDPNC
ncbi:hypothetical protein L1987_12512 [Smallanthus sonchifolius]|uniref:Uncharacterized protein n=1 Tax=Smallanthus sonchifolius TaxID=185202 RepID=A0ACB9JHF9_9ASTR|nr:hypothetical protein L1987_12512 [Smallanthus sonchifolius]